MRSQTLVSFKNYVLIFCVQLESTFFVHKQSAFKDSFPAEFLGVEMTVVKSFAVSSGNWG